MKAVSHTLKKSKSSETEGVFSNKNIEILREAKNKASISWYIL